MAVFMVTYDLNKPGKNYEPLLAAIRRFPHCYALKSAFFIESTSNASAITGALMVHLDSNDALYVLRISREWAANRPMNCTAWLQSPSRNW